jgi:hypothetical protein
MLFTSKPRGDRGIARECSLESVATLSRGSKTVGSAWFVALLAAFGVGCEKKDAPTHTERQEPIDPARLARAMGKDAADLTPPVDPPPASGDLKGDLEHFSTLDACVAERTALDPVVGDALLAIGYDTFLRDACRVLDATKAKDTKKCNPIEASALQARCESYVGMAAGNPEACPFDIAGDKTRGHDPTCIAVALRDPRLCAGEANAKRNACEALASGDEKKCEGAGGEPERKGCRRDVARWKSLLAEASPSGTPAKLPKAGGTLTLRGAEGSPDPGQPPSDLAMEVERGVVLVRELGGARIRVGSLQELGSIPHAANPVARPRIGFELYAPKDAPTEARIEHLELEVPGAITIVMPAMRTTLHAQVTTMQKVRGGEMRIVIEGTAGSAPHAFTVHAEVSTFVRDLVNFR